MYGGATLRRDAADGLLVLYEGHQRTADVLLGRRSRDTRVVRRLTGDSRVETDQRQVRLVRDTGAVLCWLVRDTGAVRCQLGSYVHVNEMNFIHFNFLRICKARKIHVL